MLKRLKGKGFILVEHEMISYFLCHAHSYNINQESFIYLRITV